MKGNKKKTCGLCHKKSKDYIKEIKCVEDILNVLNLPLNIDSSKSNSQVVCKSCFQNLKQIVEFKSKCLDVDDQIVSVSQGTKIDVLEVYTKAFTDISTNQNICRICMETVECGKLVPLNAENVDSTMLEKYFPELDLTLTRDPEICPSCLQSMQQYFDYIERYVNILKDAKRDSLNEVKDYTLSDKKASASKQKTASSKSKNCRKQKHVSSLDVNNFQCAHCAYETTSRGRILRHLHRHRESDLEKRKIPKLTCDQCSFQCRSASIFKGHKRRHQTPAAKDMTKNLNPETIMYNCEICEYKSSRKYLVKKHALTHNVESKDGTEEKDAQNTSDLKKVIKYQSDIRENQCENNVEFEEHMNKDHELSSDSPTHKQEPKRRMVRRKSSSDFHTADRTQPKKKKLVSKNPRRTKLHRCKECSFESRCHYSLVKHKMSVHNSVTEKQYLCDRCSYSTYLRFSLQRHIQTHQNVSDPYKCKICSFTTRHANKLRKHILDNHRDEKDIEQFSCQHCKYWINCKETFEKHLLWHERSVNRQRCCNVCSYKTCHKTHFDGHMLTHKQSGDVLSCEHCQYQAEDQDDFAKHLPQHKIDMKYSCIQCSYKTSLKIYLQRHMSIHKPKKKRDFVARVSQCGVCKYQSTVLVYVQRHMSRKHKDMVNDESFKIVNKFLPIEKFENALNCEFCDYKTVLKCRFVRHMKIHKVNDDGVKENMTEVSASADDIASIENFL